MNFPFFGPPPTPEERAEWDKKRAEERLAAGRKIDAALPYLREAQMSLRQAVSLGICDERLFKAMRNVAILIDVCETDLVRQR